MTASARAQLLASEQARRVVLQTLVGGVASNYFLLQDLDKEREITRHALQIREDSLALVQLRVDNGYSSELDLRQAEVLVESARTALTSLELQIEQTENQLNILLGRNPGPIIRGRPLLEQEQARPLPAGLPSAILDRRPDILEAEQQLIASHALVAVARAAYFPTISLTSSLGFESSALHNLFSGLSGTWMVGPALSMPIFNAGSIRAGVLSAEAQRQQSLLLYKKTVRRPFAKLQIHWSRAKNSPSCGFNKRRLLKASGRRRNLRSPIPRRFRQLPGIPRFRTPITRRASPARANSPPGIDQRRHPLSGSWWRLAVEVAPSPKRSLTGECFENSLWSVDRRLCLPTGNETSGAPPSPRSCFCG